MLGAGAWAAIAGLALLVARGRAPSWPIQTPAGPITLESLTHGRAHGPEIDRALYETAMVVLVPYAARYGELPIVTSGLRDAEANRNAGGVTGSLHLTGRALDLAARDGNTERLLARVAATATAWDLLYIDPADRHVHIEIPDGTRTRGRIARLSGGTLYTHTPQAEA